jgi:ABC-type Zn uptake system ZnuABC Zn-binding protein ZnuA
MGDVHALGNPHYLLDPLNGIRVAAVIAGRLGAERPERKTEFAARLDAFRTRIHAALVGETLAKKYDAEKLATLFERGKLEEFLRSQGDEAALGGWLGLMAGREGTPAVADHNLWPYFARRFGLHIEGYLEPKPGVAPTTAHLRALIEKMKAGGVRLILTSPYFDARHAEFVAQQTGAAIVRLAHMPGARPLTDDYIAMCDFNVRAVAAALNGVRP